jgi:hypothetical protein
MMHWSGDLQNLAMLAVARLGPNAVAGRVRELLAELTDRDVFGQHGVRDIDAS